MTVNKSTNGRNKVFIGALFLSILLIFAVVAIFVRQQDKKASELLAKEHFEIMEQRKDSLYRNFTTRCLDIADVHGFVKSLKVETKIMSKETYLLPFENFRCSFDRNGEIDSIYNDKALVTHQGARSIIVKKYKVEGGDEFLNLDYDHFRYDIFDQSSKNTFSYTKILCDNTKGFIVDKINVDYLEYKDKNYQKMKITEVVLECGYIKTTIEYTYTKFDSIGNWTERIGQCSQVCEYYPSSVDKFQIKETRSIKYYAKTDVYLDELLTNNTKNESTNSELYNELRKVYKLVEDQEQQQDLEQQSMSRTESQEIDLSQLTIGQWYANDSDSETDWWYTYRSDGSGRLKVRVPNFNSPIESSFTWSINNGILRVSWDSDFAAITNARGWSGEIQKLKADIMDIYDNKTYSHDVYKHVK